MDNNSQNANINVIVDASQAQQAVKQLSDEVQKLSNVMGKLTQQQNSLSSFSASIEAVARQLQALNLANTNASKQMAVAAGSYDATKKRLKDLEEQIKATGGGLTNMSPAVKQMVGEYNKLEAQVRSFDEQMGNSGKAFNDFKSNLDALIETVPEFANGFGAGLTAVGEQLPDLIEGYKGFRSENAALAAQGQPTKSILSQLAGSFLSWNAAINVGITLLTAYGPQIWDFFKTMIFGKDTIDVAAENFKNMNEIMKASNKAVAEESTKLKILYEAATNANIPLAERHQAVIKLQTLYPEYFKNLDDEAFRNGKAKKSYDDLSASLLQQAKAKAALTKMEQLYSKISDAEYQKEKIKIAHANEKIRFQKQMVDKGKSGGSFINPSYMQNSPEDRQEKEGIENRFKDSTADQDAIIDATTRQINYVVKSVGGANKLAKIINGGVEQASADANTGGGKGGNITTNNNTYTNKANVNTVKKNAEALEMLKTSQAQQLQVTVDGYAQQMTAANTHYDEELKRLQKLKKDKLVDSDIAHKVEVQLLKEHQATVKSIIDNYNKEDKEKTLALSNELIELQIAGMAEGAEKQIDEINHQTKLKTQALDAQKAELSEAISKGDASVKALLESGDGAAAAVERTHLISLRAQLDALAQKRKMLVTAGDKAVEDVRKAQEDQKKAAKNKATADLDDAEVSKTNGPGKEVAHFKALLTQLEHRKQAELENTKLTEEEKKKIVDKYKLDKAALEKTEHDRKLNDAIQTEEKIRSAAMNLLGGALKQASEARLRQLNQDKTLELSNTSLTKSQKKAIEDKYKKLELQEKQRAFKQEQKMQIANAVMAGAVAVVKDLGSPWKIAFDIAMTAAQVATILKQKAPAYATGGLHYASDGRGALLSGPGTGTSDSMNARLSNGEAVINARSTGMFGDVLSAINVAGGGKPFGSYWGSAFAGGGTMGNTYLPTRNNPARLSTPVLASPMIDYDMLAASMTKVSLVLDVKDVNREQANLARAVNGSSH